MMTKGYLSNEKRATLAGLHREKLIVLGAWLSLFIASYAVAPYTEDNRFLMYGASAFLLGTAVKLFGSLKPSLKDSCDRMGNLLRISGGFAFVGTATQGLFSCCSQGSRLLASAARAVTVVGANPWSWVQRFTG